jgi:hypothetical protein
VKDGGKRMVIFYAGFGSVYQVSMAVVMTRIREILVDVSGSLGMIVSTGGFYWHGNLLIL